MKRLGTLVLLAIAVAGCGESVQTGEVEVMLEDCVVRDVGGGRFDEICRAESENADTAGEWFFSYREGAGTQRGDAELRAPIFWHGDGERRVDASGWTMDAGFDAEADDGELTLFLIGEGSNGPSYQLFGLVEYVTDEGDRPLLSALLGLVALAIIGTPAVIASLKGRWWMGVLGVALVVAWFVFAFVLEEPSDEFQETFTFDAVQFALQFALPVGLGLLVVGSFMKARPGSWWDGRDRDTAGARPAWVPKLRRAALGMLIGAAPGLILLLLSGPIEPEMDLLVGVAGLFLTPIGAIVGLLVGWSTAPADNDIETNA